MHRSHLVLVGALFVVSCGGTSPTPTPAPTQPPTPPPTASPSPTPQPSPLTPAVIQVGHGPCAITDLDGSIWVTDYGDGTLVRIDPLTNVADEPIRIGSNPCGLTALDGDRWVGVLATD